MTHIKYTSEEKPNRLEALKLLVFLFFGALTCLYAHLPSHMEWLGFTRQEIRLVTLYSALASILGPLIVGLILDRVSVNRPASYGKWLRVLMFLCFIAVGVLFGCLLIFKPGNETKFEKAQNVTFSCDMEGAHLYDKRNQSETCRNINNLKGHLELMKCSYTCEKPENYSKLWNSKGAFDKDARSEYKELNEISSEAPSSEDDYLEENSLNTSEELPAPEAYIQKTTVSPKVQPLYIPPPHICINESNVLCHVYLEVGGANGDIITLENVRGGEIDPDDNFDEYFCKHKLESFSCHIPEAQVKWMNLTKHKQDAHDCIPAVECIVNRPYAEGSILENKISTVSRGPPYGGYYAIRIIAEVFPLILHMLLNISIIIATRETSVGRGNVGHQWAFYPIGVLVFASVLGLANHLVTIISPETVLEPFWIPIGTFAVTMFVCAIVVLLSSRIPLTPSDWWWHTKCGLLAIPMSALKRYKWVIIAIALSSFVLGTLWHAQEAFRHIFTIDIIERACIGDGEWRSKTFVYVIGSLLAIPLIWNGEKIVDCLGHSNIFILSFLSFALRFSGLYLDEETSWSTLYEIIEPISFYLAWLALLLFVRHLVPKRLLALGQALLVILFFGFGRGIGFFFGVSVESEPQIVKQLGLNVTLSRQSEVADLQDIHTVFAMIALISALIYFIVYFVILLPKFRVPINQLNGGSDSSLSPQRVFHDERSRKGHFRY